MNSPNKRIAQDSNNYWEQLERLEKLIRASELKAGIIFSFHGVILGLFFDRFEQIKQVFSENKAFIVLALLWIICVLISIYYCFKCFRPQIESKYDKNVFFFKDAVHAFGNVKEFSKKLVDVYGDQKDFYKQLSEQIHAESKIINEKFKSVQKAILFFALSFLFIVIGCLIYAISII
jgi:hypothetical protein